jgi:hypothetical protein
MSSRAALLAGVLALAGPGCADLERGDPLPDAAAPDSGAGSTGDAASGDGAAARSFARDVHPLLVDRCRRCHSSSGEASDTDLVLSDDAAQDLVQVGKIIDPANPAGSRLLTKAAGMGHSGGTVLAAGSPEHQTIVEWISQGSAP